MCICDTAILQCVEIFCVWVRRRLNWQLLRTSPSVMPSVNDVLIWFFVISVELATDVHQRNVLGVVASPFLWHDLNRQIFVIDSTFVTLQLSFHSLFPQIRFTHFYSKFPISRPSFELSVFYRTTRRQKMKNLEPIFVLAKLAPLCRFVGFVSIDAI